jgi:small-conductance mechanosensitive channel
MQVTRDPALKLFHDLAADMQEGNFLVQVLIVLACLGVAWFFASWWQRRHVEGAGRIADAGARLAFPLAGVLLTGAALLALKPFIHVNLLKLALPLFGSMALVRAVVFVLRQAFPKATWLATWERIIAFVIWGSLALYITNLAPHVIEALEGVSFPLGAQRLNLWLILQGMVTVFLTVVVALWVAGMIEARLMRMEGVDSSLRIVGVRVAKALLTVAALVTGLTMVGIDMTAFSVFTGALGVGLGLGMQRIASNYVSGFIILLDRSIRIGDMIQVSTDNSQSGQVSKITTRYTVLKHATGTEFIVPNEALISNVVQNQSYSDNRLRLATTIGVAYDTDLELAMRLMRDAAAAQPRVLSDLPPAVFLTAFAESAISLELGFWIADPEAGRGNIVSDVNLAVWRAFKEHGIRIPFPQREVRLLEEVPLPAA